MSPSRQQGIGSERSVELQQPLFLTDFSKQSAHNLRRFTHLIRLLFNSMHRHIVDKDALQKVQNSSEIRAAQ
jgi:hypothetical protein